MKGLAVLFLMCLKCANSVEPGRIRISLQDNSGIVNKCQSNTSFIMKCHIPIASARVRATSEDSLITKLQSTEEGGYYVLNFQVFPKEVGILTMTCEAYNAKYRDKKSEHIVVQEPPPSRPVMTVNDGHPIVENDFVTLAIGDTIKVKCHVDGGYPNVSEVTTTCGTIVNTSIGIESTLTINVAKENNNMKCTCQAVHASQCYDKTSRFNLRVLYTHCGGYDESDNDVNSGIHMGAGFALAVVVYILARLCVFKWRKVRKNRHLSQQQQQQQHPLQQRQHHGSHQQPPRHEDISLDTYDTLNGNDIQESPIGRNTSQEYLAVVPQCEENTMESANQNLNRGAARPNPTNATHEANTEQIAQDEPVYLEVLPDLPITSVDKIRKV